MLPHKKCISNELQYNIETFHIISTEYYIMTYKYPARAPETTVAGPLSLVCIDLLF